VYQRTLYPKPATKCGKGSKELMVVKAEGKREPSLLPFLKSIALDKPEPPCSPTILTLACSPKKVVTSYHDYMKSGVFVELE
jgi:hypothetical protein